MRPLLIVLSLILSLNTAFAGNCDLPARDGFVPLFNGEDLSGWHGMPHFDPRKLDAMSEEERAAQIAKWTEDAKQHWSVDNGELVNDGKGAYLTTDKEYGDIELLIEYKTVAKADSGIYLRGTPQVQIWDTTEEGGKWDRNADKGSGGLFNNSKGAPGQLPLVLADRPFGEWNTFHIIQVGARTTVYMNDQLVVDHAIMENYWDRDAALFSKGPIQLQTHGGEIRWRNIYVREIPPKEATEILVNGGVDRASGGSEYWAQAVKNYQALGFVIAEEESSAEEGFESLFNGEDTTGWKGPVDNYQVKDGTLMCLPGKGGTIYHENEYGDFVARLEFKLPAGGNNGLAIRYPGNGNPAYAGMCELQVLDNDADKYAKLDPRQYHGSAYGMVAAKRGCLRPVGEWNYQEVTVKGSTIKVELNGYVILDADLSTVTEFMANSPHPGKDLKQGHFGFAGHNDPVQFRNIRIKSLD